MKLVTQIRGVLVEIDVESLIKRLQEALDIKDEELSSTIEELRSSIQENKILSKRVEDLEKQMKILRNLNEILRRKLIKKSKSRPMQTLRR